MALQLLIDGVDHISELVHESLRIDQTRDGLNSTCKFDIRDAGVVRKGVWTAGVTRVGDGDVITGHTAFPSAKVEVSVVDGATVYFAGILSRVTRSALGQIVVGTQQQPEVQLLRCACHDFNQILEESIVDSFEEFDGDTDEFIIDHIFTNYVTGIDFASNVSGLFVAGKVSFEGITVRQVLDILVAKSGYVWYVDYSKKLWYKSAGADAPAWHLSDAPDDVNSFSYFAKPIKEEDATNLVNMVFIIGAVESAWYTNQASRDEYGDHRAVLKDARYVDLDDLEDRADALLNKFKDPIVTYRVKTYKDGLRAGMKVRFVCAYYDVDDEFLISRLAVTFPVDGEPVYDLTLGGLESSLGSAAHRLTLDKIQELPDIIPAQLPLASRGWGHDLTFSATDNDTVAWGAGTLTTASGQSFAIAAGNTDDPGAMTAKTIVYLDTAISVTTLQMTTDETAALGYNRIMVAVAWPSGEATVDAGFQVFGATGELATYLNATNIIADCITANEIYGNTLSVIAADMGLLNAGEIRLGDGGTPGVDFNGLRMYKSGAVYRLEGQKDGTLQAYFDSDGKLMAGAGALMLDEDGITIDEGATDTSIIKWKTTGGVSIATVYGLGVGDWPILYLQASVPQANTHGSRVSIVANPFAGFDSAQIDIRSAYTGVAGYIKLRVGGNDGILVYEDYAKACKDFKVDDDLRVLKGLYVGADADPDDNDIWCDGEISTDGGTNKWELGAAFVGTPTCDRYLRVWIGGVRYHILAEYQATP